MARAKVIHSQDACTIVFTGDINTGAEPSTGIIKFPGGEVEVARCSDNTYWVHVKRYEDAKVVSSRINYDYEGDVVKGLGIPQIPESEHCLGFSLKLDGEFKDF